jgi:hypothetical protein
MPQCGAFMPGCRLFSRRVAVTLGAGLGLGFGLTGCSSSEQFPPACPSVAILADAGDLTRYSGRGQDLTDLVLDGRITGVSGECKRGDNNVLDTTIKVSLDITRGPAAHGGAAEFAYFVAVTRNGVILDKQVYPLRAEFPTNTDRLRLSSDEVQLLLPIPKGLSGAAYTVLVGFQLDQAELDLNRRRGPR